MPIWYNLRSVAGERLKRPAADFISLDGWPPALTLSSDDRFKLVEEACVMRNVRPQDIQRDIRVMIIASQLVRQLRRRYERRVRRELAAAARGNVINLRSGEWRRT